MNITEYSEDLRIFVVENWKMMAQEVTHALVSFFSHCLLRWVEVHDSYSLHHLRLLFDLTGHLARDSILGRCHFGTN